MTIILSILAIVAFLALCVGAGFMLNAIDNAPDGYEDRTGFHRR